MTELLLELTALLTFWLCLAAWQRDRATRGRRLFIGLCGAAFLWSAGDLAQALAATPYSEGRQLSYLGILTAPALWLGLALVVRGAPIAQRAPWGLALILAPACTCYVLLFWESELASWLLTSTATGGIDFGPLWWLMGGYSWALAGLGCFHFGMSARRLRGRGARLRRVALTLGSLLPFASSAVYATTDMPGFDATPILLGDVWLVALRSDLFSGHLLQALPLSQHDLVSQLPTPLILTDSTDRVTEINPAAESCLGIAKADALDRNIQALLEAAIFAPEFERWSLVASGREAGSILLPTRTRPEDPK